MSTQRKSQKEQHAHDLWERDIEAKFVADEIMSVIRCSAVKSAWRDGLLEAHFHAAYHYAHHENERIDYAVTNASWLKSKPDSIAGRILARRAAEQQVPA